MSKTNPPSKWSGETWQTQKNQATMQTKSQFRLLVGTLLLGPAARGRLCASDQRGGKRGDTRRFIMVVESNQRQRSALRLGQAADLILALQPDLPDRLFRR